MQAVDNGLVALEDADDVSGRLLPAEELPVVGSGDNVLALTERKDAYLNHMHLDSIDLQIFDSIQYGPIR